MDRQRLSTDPTSMTGADMKRISSCRAGLTSEGGNAGRISNNVQPDLAKTLSLSK